MASLGNSTKHTMKNLYWSFPEEGILPKLFYESTITHISKPRHYKQKQRKSRANTFDEYIRKNSQQNVSKQNSLMQKRIIENDQVGLIPGP